MIMSRKEAEALVYENITCSNIVGIPDQVVFTDGTFGTVTWLDSDGTEVEAIKEA